MKAIIVVDSSGADIAFYSLNKAFEHYIIQRFKTLGFTDPDDPKPVDMRSALMAFFIPFNTAIDVMNSWKLPLYSIGCENNLILVFKKFENNVYIGVGQNGEGSEQIVTRRILVFHSIVSLLYGPAVDRMNPEDPDQKAIEWALLNNALREYDRLYRETPSFLLEALEYFQFDYPAETNAIYNICQKLVRDVLVPQNNGGIKRLVYCTILVDSKPVIAPKSSRVKPPDVLLTILIVSALFSDQIPAPPDYQPPSCAYPERRTSYEFDAKGIWEVFGVALPYSPLTSAMRNKPLVHQVQRDEDPNNNDSAQCETPYQTPHGTPGPVDRITPPPSYSDLVGQAVGYDEPEPFRGLKRVMDIVGGPSTGASVGGAYQAKNPPSEPTTSNQRFIEHMIFIQGKPHMLHCLELYKGIVLVLISELYNKEFSTVVIEAVHDLNVIFGGSLQKGQPVRSFDALDATMKKIVNIAKQEAQTRCSDQLKRLTVQVQKSWEGIKHAELKTYLEKLQEGQIDSNSAQSIRIDTQGRDLTDRLLRLFGGVYFSLRVAEYDSNVAKDKLVKLCNEVSRDYAGFLIVKANLSFPVVNFAEQYSGLIHFIFIDRSYGDMKMPTIFDEGQSCTIQYVDNLAKRGLDCTPGTYLKRKMWKMVEHVQVLLEQGYIVQCWKDAEFLYTYHAWVNIPYADIAGPIRYHQPKVQCEVFNIPGIIGTPFYSSLSHAPRSRDPRKGINIAEGSDCFLYELYCIHETSVPVGQAMKHSRMLVKTLWETTQEAQIPFH